MEPRHPYLIKAVKSLRLAGLAILSLLLLIGCYLLAAYVLSRIGVDRQGPAASDVSIYLLTNGVHTDVVLPLRTDQVDWTREIRFEHTQGKDSSMNFVALGWGDKGFYLHTPTWDDLTFPTAFRAAFALSSSAIHATFYKSMEEGEQCVRIDISREDYARLTNYVRQSFRPDAQGRFVPISTTANYGANDAFYEAAGRYSLFYTCNTWANEALKSCRQKACLWTAFDTGIFYHYKK
jgi:uncharacterized protein (TIGR02117 family)